MRLLAIDGNSILNRAYYGIRALSNKKVCLLMLFWDL